MKNLLKTLSFGAAAVIVTVLVVATILENLFGSPFAIENIYHSPWFIALWALLAVTATAYILRTQRRVSLILLHASFVMVLLGAFVSFLTSKRGDMAISQGGVPASMFETSDGTLQKLPFRMQLADVDTKYSDNGTVSGYSVSIMADSSLHTLSLNTPVKINGYQFCIKGVDEEGVSLLVAYDPYGRPISYLGYAMVFLSFLTLFFDRQSGFKALLYKVKAAGKREQRKSLLLLCRAGAGSSTRSVVKAESGKLVSTSFCLLVLSVFLCILWYGRGMFSATNGAEALLLLWGAISASCY